MFVPNVYINTVWKLQASSTQTDGEETVTWNNTPAMKLMAEETYKRVFQKKKKKYF